MFEIIKFDFHKDKRGILLMIQGKDAKGKNRIPFKIRRVYFIKDIKTNEIRGNHAHKKTTQFILPISGGCTAEFDNGTKKEKIRLVQFNKGVVVHPYIWLILKEFKKNTVLLVLADKEHNEKDYIRNYEDFIQQIKHRVSKK